MFDTFDNVAPSSRDFACTLACLNAGATGKELVKSQQITQVLGKGAHLNVVEGSRCLCYLRCLIDQCFNDLGMAMPLIS